MHFFSRIVLGLLCTATVFQSFARNQDFKNSIRVTVSNECRSDLSGLKLVFYPEVFSVRNNTTVPFVEQDYQLTREGQLSFVINRITSPGYICIVDSKDSSINKDALTLYLAEPGDDISIIIRDNSQPGNAFNKRNVVHPAGNFTYLYQHPEWLMLFSGKGAARYECQYEIDRIVSTLPFSGRLITLRNDSVYIKRSNLYDSAKTISLAILERYKSRVTASAYQILKADIIGKWNKENVIALYSAIRGNLERKLSDTIYSVYKKWYQPDRAIPDYAIAESKTYSDYLLTCARLRAYYTKGRGAAGEVYEILRQENRGKMFDKVVTLYFMESGSQTDQEEYAKRLKEGALKEVRTSFFLDILEGYARTLPGNKAFDFQMENVKGEKVSLRDLRGKVVFIDFWFTGCSACRGYFQDVVSNVEHRFKNNPDVIFATVSVDRDREKWLKSIEGGRYTTSSALNLFAGKDGADHPMLRFYNIHSFPRSMLLDQEGRMVKFNDAELFNKEKLELLISSVLNTH